MPRGPWVIVLMLEGRADRYRDCGGAMHLSPEYAARYWTWADAAALCESAADNAQNPDPLHRYYVTGHLAAITLRAARRHWLGRRRPARSHGNT